MFAEKRDPPPAADERLGRWILGGPVLIALGAGAWNWQKRQSAEPETVTAEAVVADEPRILNPIETPAGTDPALSAIEQVAALVGAERFAAMFVPDDFVRNVVATGVNLARPKVAARMNPAKPPEGAFVTAGNEGNGPRRCQFRALHGVGCPGGQPRSGRDGRAVPAESITAPRNLVSQSPVGSQVKIRVLRGGREFNVTAVIAELPKEIAGAPAEPAPEDVQQNAFSGIK